MNDRRLPSQEFMGEVFTRVQQLGLKVCPICGGEVLRANSIPATIHHGNTDDGPLMFGLSVTCDTCGYLMVFDFLAHKTTHEIFPGS